MNRAAFFITCMVFVLAGCADQPRLEPPNPVETYYQNMPPPPVGFSRVYILPAMDDKAEVLGEIYVGPSEDEKAQAFSLRKNQFAVFDVKPGPLFVDYEPYEDYYFDEAKMFTVASQQTLVLRPISHFSGNVFFPLNGSGGGNGDGLAIIVGIDLAMVPVSGVLHLFTTREPEFEVLDPKSALQEIRARKLSVILPDAPPSLRQ